jgi:hypothetical protein
MKMGTTATSSGSTSVRRELDAVPSLILAETREHGPLVSASKATAAENFMVVVVRKKTLKLQRRNE